MMDCDAQYYEMALCLWPAEEPFLHPVLRATRDRMVGCRGRMVGCLQM